MMGVSKRRHLTPIELIAKKTELYSEQVPLQHGGQDTELGDQRLSSDNRTMLLYSNQQKK